MSHTNSAEKAIVESLLVKQLYKEYENILYVYNLKLKTPKIILTKASSYYGMWCAKTRTINLTLSLLLENSWLHVLQILKHEMAHQYVDDIFAADDNHGLFFQKACELLRVEKWARKSCITSDKSLFKMSEEQQLLVENKPLRLVRKLLRLSASSNKNEAFLALKKASEIAQKHQIKEADIAHENCFVSLILKTGRRKVHGYEALITNILIEHFLIKVIYSSLFNPEQMYEEKTIEFFGSAQNVKMAEYVYMFLSRKVCDLWKDHQRVSSEKGLKLKNQFIFGVLHGLENQLEREKRKNKRDFSFMEGHVPQLYDKKLLDFVVHKHPKTVQSKSSSSILKSKSYYDGFEKGEKIKILVPLSERRQKLLR